MIVNKIKQYYAGAEKWRPVDPTATSLNALEVEPRRGEGREDGDVGDDSQES